MGERDLGSVSHPGSYLVGNFLRMEFFGEQCGGGMSLVNTGSISITLGEVYPAKVGLPEITPAEIHAGDFKPAKVYAPKVTMGCPRFGHGH